MQTQFINDIDDYSCKIYANYSKICSLNGFVTPAQRKTSTEYKIADEKYKLCYQANAPLLLNELKKVIYPSDFSFSFAPVPMRERIADVFRKDTFKRILPKVLAKYSLNESALFERLNIPLAVWKKIVNGSFYPEKNTIFAIALAVGMRENDAKDLLAVCGFVFDYENARDVVVSYLIEYKVFSVPIVKEIFKEYQINCIPLKKIA